MNSMQTEFDLVVSHLLCKQGRPARDNGVCLYRATGGLSCAVGCRIPDNMYKPEMDTMASGTDLNSIIEYGFDLPEEILEYSAMFVVLQSVHDRAITDGGGGDFDIEALTKNLLKVADYYKLILNVPLEVV